MTFSTAGNQTAIRPQAALPVSWYGRAVITCLECWLVPTVSTISLSINGCLLGSKTTQITSGRIIIVLVAAAKLFHGHVGLAEE